MAAGYSGTPLGKKLGVKDGHHLTVIDAPPDWPELSAEFPTHVPEAEMAGADVVILFVQSVARFEALLPEAAEAIFPDKALWVAWPKRASKVPTDMTEDVVRALALPIGLVDNKVCAISSIWSGLRVVWRKENRRR